MPHWSVVPLVARGISRAKASCVFDVRLTGASGNLIKVFGWYDSECSFSCRLADLAELVGVGLSTDREFAVSRAIRAQSFATC